MSIFDIIYTILISPLQLFFEVVYMLANTIIDNPGMSIVVLSLAMNFLVLPLYKRADAMQDEERDIEQKLHKGVTHIKKTFKGDERMMILQAYYRQNDYKPAYVFKSALSLFLEIPFFIAAYQFLSHLEVIQGVSFGIIRDLGAPDALININGMHINLLPIIMTAVNLVSCVIFTKGYPTKTKVQLYSMAIFFFVFLYTSPSGLVFYWTLNNIFSLVKTIFYKLKNAKQILRIMAAVAGVLLLIVSPRIYHPDFVKRCVCVVGIGILLLLPLVIGLICDHSKIQIKPLPVKANKKVFLTGAIFTTILVGCVIPSMVIKSSPQEFVDLFHYMNPLWYICSSLCLAIGTFVVWFGVFYWLMTKEKRVYFDLVMWILAGVGIVNYMFFGKNMGLLSNTLIFEEGMNFTHMDMIKNAGILILVIVGLTLVFRFGKKLVPQVLFIGALALIGVSVSSVVKINDSVSEIAKENEKIMEEMPSFELSKTGKNVVVFMLDRAINEYIPYFMNEKPELKEIYSGFTYYPNTLSFGSVTNIASPALFGGYEYTPIEINKRDTESLESKQNEALKVMPVLFDENGYDVTVCDPPYAGYQWTPDLSIYDDYPDIKKYITKGLYGDTETKERLIKNNKRNFFCYSLMKAMPVCLQSVLYDAGNYNQGNVVVNSSEWIAQSHYESTGISPAFLEPYAVLENLTTMTKITEQDENTFLMLANDTTHDPIFMQEPEYVPAMHVDNNEYEANHWDRYTVDGKSLNMVTDSGFAHYQTNMATLIQVGKWIQYLKDNGVYDNTRIILVADHGRGLGHFPELTLDDGSEIIYDTELYNPLLMVKDFNAQEFTVSKEFMTNGDVPTIATQGLIKNPINPFTGKEINEDEKTAHDQYVFGSNLWNTDENNGNTFIPGIWFSVHTDRGDPVNWKVLPQESTFPQE